MSARFRGRAAGVALAAALCASALGCKERVSRVECDALLSKFSELVVKEKFPSASPEAIRAVQAKEREEAARDDNFKNCTTELRQDDYRCAMSAATSEALLRCLE